MLVCLKKNFSKSQRLYKKEHIQAVFANKRKLAGCFFSIFFSKNDINNSRLCIIVAKKNIRFAVQRNKIKRIIRESFRINQHTLKGLDIVVYPYRTNEEINNQQWLLNLDKQWQKLNKHASC